MRIAIGCDHRGVPLKQHLAKYLALAGHTLCDGGTDSEQSIDYPDIAVTIGHKVSQGEVERGILICGTGIGMAIAANKLPGVRAAVCPTEGTAQICRRHNDVNVLCLPGDLSTDAAVRVVDAWLQTPFEGGRHARRVEKIAAIEQNRAGRSPAESSPQSPDCR